ncbi:hypothetical protein ES708_22943 [subsurface metagenome]
MNQYSKIVPKWGKNNYNLWSCESLQYEDPELEKIAHSISSSQKVSFKQMRKFNKIACMDCKHYISGQCPLSNEQINQSAKRYKNLKPKCTVCGLPLSFHHFLLYKNSHEKLCTMCLEAKNNGNLEEKKKKQKKSKILEICELIIMCFVMFFTFMDALLDGVFDWEDYFFIGFISLIPIGYIIYKIIKGRKKKKIEEGN